MDVENFQKAVHDWCIHCFGAGTANDVEERNWRFLEEALELVQSLGGNADDAHQLVDYVFSRDAGNPSQETGGVMLTLSALCSASKIEMGDAAFAEFTRVMRPEMIEKIRRKHATKPRNSSLPGDYKYAAPAPLEREET